MLTSKKIITIIILTIRIIISIKIKTIVSQQWLILTQIKETGKKNFQEN